MLQKPLKDNSFQQNDISIVMCNLEYENFEQNVNYIGI